MVYDVVYVCLCAAHFNTYPRHDINKLVYFWIDVVSARGGGSVYSIRERGRIYNVLLIQPLARKHFSSPNLTSHLRDLDPLPISYPEPVMTHPKTLISN